MKIKIFFLIFVSIIVLATIIFFLVNHTSPNTSAISSNQTSAPNQIPSNKNISAPITASTTHPALTQPIFNEPIGNALSRVTKKPFGIYVSPNNSPVSPEKFTGYHTGVDFETSPDETNIDVPIYAICDGSLALKEYASGYGGVAVESCKLNGQDITVIYGHLKLSSININVGNQLSAGQQIGILGKGYSTETDGERKHLHLGIHKGTAINILGYVQNQAELENWIDVTKYLK